MKLAHKKKKIFLIAAALITIIYLGSVLFVRTSYNLQRILGKGNFSKDTDSQTLSTPEVFTKVVNEKYYASSIEMPLSNMAVSARVVEEYEKWLKDSGILNIKTEKDAEKAGLSDTKKYEYTASFKVYDTDKYISYVYEIITDTRGAHPNTYHTIFNFRKSDGKEILAITDLYLDNVYETLSKLARSNLRTQFMENERFVESLDEMTGEMFISGTEAKPENFSKFYFKDKNTMTIVFDKYAIGPYSIGDWGADISLYSIKKLLR